MEVHQAQHPGPWKRKYPIPWKTGENQVHLKWHSPNIIFQSLITSLGITWDKGYTLELFTFWLPKWFWSCENKAWQEYSIPCSLPLQFHEGENLRDSWSSCRPALADWDVTHLPPVTSVLCATWLSTQDNSISRFTWPRAEVTVKNWVDQRCLEFVVKGPLCGVGGVCSPRTHRKMSKAKWCFGGDQNRGPIFSWVLEHVYLWRHAKSQASIEVKTQKWFSFVEIRAFWCFCLKEKHNS